MVAAGDPERPIGIVTRSDLLKARSRSLEEEGERRRYLWSGAGPPAGETTPAV